HYAGANCCARPHHYPHMGTRRRPYKGLRVRRLRCRGCRGPTQAHGTEGKNHFARWRIDDRLARKRRSRPDDGPRTIRVRGPFRSGPLHQGERIVSVDVITFGCRLNTYESEAIRREAAAAGVDDAVIVNTCAVTAEAVRQAKQTIRRLKRERPHARIVVTGCAAQTEAGGFAAMADVDRVVGNEEKFDARTWSLPDKIAVSDIMAVKTMRTHAIDGLEGRSRAFVQVQNGCDHRCTFCIIPYGRGNSRSLAVHDVIAQVRRLADNGYREIVLTGVDITSYGADLPGAPRLGALVKRILRDVSELDRLRLSSIDSVEADA